MESPSPSPTFDLAAWREGIDAFMASTNDSVEIGLDLARLGIFGLVLIGGLCVAMLVGLVVIGVRR